jgi:hypothetical protein
LGSVRDYEVVLRREGEEDEAISLGFEHAHVGRAFEREGEQWIVTKDDGPSQWPGHLARLIAEPDPEGER